MSKLMIENLVFWALKVIYFSNQSDEQQNLKPSS